MIEIWPISTRFASLKCEATNRQRVSENNHNNDSNNDRLYCMLPSYKYSLVYNKDPIDKGKAIEKTYIHL